MSLRVAAGSAFIVFVLIISFFVMRDWAFNKMVNSLLSNKIEVINPVDVNLLKTIILDTREKIEYDISHLPGAIWVGYENFDLNRVKANKEDDILVYCSIGKRSNDIALKLQSEGFSDVKNLHGGIFKWVNENYGVVNQSGNTNKVHTYSMSWSIWLKNGEGVN